MQAVGAGLGEKEFGNEFIQMSLYLVCFGSRAYSAVLKGNIQRELETGIDKALLWNKVCLLGSFLLPNLAHSVSPSGKQTEESHL